MNRLISLGSVAICVLLSGVSAAAQADSAASPFRAPDCLAPPLVCFHGSVPAAGERMSTSTLFSQYSVSPDEGQAPGPQTDFDTALFDAACRSLDSATRMLHDSGRLNRRSYLRALAIAEAFRTVSGGEFSEALLRSFVSALNRRSVQLRGSSASLDSFDREGELQFLRDTAELLPIRMLSAPEASVLFSEAPGRIIQCRALAEELFLVLAVQYGDIDRARREVGELSADPMRSLPQPTAHVRMLIAALRVLSARGHSDGRNDFTSIPPYAGLFFDLARPVIIAVNGATGAGKSTFAEAAAAAFRIEYISGDAVRQAVRARSGGDSAPVLQRSSYAGGEPGTRNAFAGIFTQGDLFYPEFGREIDRRISEGHSVVVEFVGLRPGQNSWLWESRANILEVAVSPEDAGQLYQQIDGRKKRSSRPQQLSYIATIAAYDQYVSGLARQLGIAVVRQFFFFEVLDYPRPLFRSGELNPERMAALDSTLREQISAGLPGEPAVAVPAIESSVVPTLPLCTELEGAI